MFFFLLRLKLPRRSLVSFLSDLKGESFLNILSYFSSFVHLLLLSNCTSCLSWLTTICIYKYLFTLFLTLCKRLKVIPTGSVEHYTVVHSRGLEVFSDLLACGRELQVVVLGEPLGTVTDEQGLEGTELRFIFCEDLFRLLLGG
jgi:hypothetical protein